MAWVALILSLAVLWFASLCKILHGSSSSAMKAAFGGSSQRRNVLLVIAHPDDESMFFTPVINYLTKSGHNLHILCLSTGNADGMGSIRKEELHLACAVLKIPSQQVNVLDHPDLQDGFGKAWDWSLLASLIDNEIRVDGLADRIGDMLLELEPDSSGGYVMLGNLYAASEKWDKFSQLRKKMKEREPGFSRIEVNGKSHVFLVGDISHPEMKEFYTLLREKLVP